MIATLAGVLLAAAVLFAPRHGILGRRHAALKLPTIRLNMGGPAERNKVVSNAGTR